MDITPLYIAASICGIIGLFIGLMNCLTEPADRELTYGDAANWIFGCIALLIISFLVSILP